MMFVGIISYICRAILSIHHPLQFLPRCLMPAWLSFSTQLALVALRRVEQTASAHRVAS